MTVLLRWILLAGLALSLEPRTLHGQQPDATIRPSIDSLLAATRAETLILGLASRFLREIRVLVPDLTAEQGRVLAAAVDQGFTPLAVQEDVATVMAERAPANLVRDVLAQHRSGATAELARTAAAFQPQGTVSEFLARAGAPQRDRLQRMVQLAELEGGGTLDLLLDEKFQEQAHALVTRLGGRPAPLERISNESFEGTYRERVLQLGFANLHRLQPVSDDLLGRVLAELSGEAGRWHVDAYSAAVIAAANAAAARVAALIVVADSASDTDLPPGVHCSGAPCLVWVDWDGPEPDAFNLRFGAAGALGARVMDNLGSTYYRLGGSQAEQRFMIRLVPRVATRICDFMSGTDTEQCDAIVEVTVEFRGRYGELPTPPGFTVRNRCDADAALHVDKLGAFVAVRIQHALFRPTEQPPSMPRC